MDANTNKTGKKRTAWSVIKYILLFIGGSIVGTIGTLIVIALLVFLVLGMNSSKFSALSKESEVLNKDTISKIDELERTINYYYYEDIDPEDLENGLYDGIMAGVGDPYTCYYDPEELKEMMAGWDGNYEGIGAYLKMNTDVGYAQIESFIDGGSAVECGLIAPGDYIVAVDGEEVYGMTLDEVVALVRGPEGTTVDITFEGPNGKYDVTLERRKIDTPTVKVEEKENGIWYIQITEFDAITTSQFKEAFQQAKDADMKGLIIDLRGNPGGNLDVVVDICREILPQGMIVYTEDKYGKRDEYKNNEDHTIDVPMVLLVDGGSASASEIMAGAVKDYGVGTLIGTKTYGKGIVQSVIPFTDGSAVKITTSKYYTPNGNNIHKIGIEPDIEVAFDAEKYQEDETDNQLEAAIDKIKEQLK